MYLYSSCPLDLQIILSSIISAALLSKIPMRRSSLLQKKVGECKYLDHHPSFDKVRERKSDFSI